MQKEKEKLIQLIISIYEDNCHGEINGNKYYYYDHEKLYNNLKLLTPEQLYFYYYYIDKENLKQTCIDNHEVSIGEILPINNKGVISYNEIPENLDEDLLYIPGSKVSDSYYPYFGQYMQQGDSKMTLFFSPIYQNGYPYIKNYKRRSYTKKINAANTIRNKFLQHTYNPDKHSTLFKLLKESFNHNQFMRNTGLLIQSNKEKLKSKKSKGGKTKKGGKKKRQKNIFANSAYRII
jgi:hypothetical protein